MEKWEQCYGRAWLSELEHELAESEIRKFCFNNKIKFYFYRMMKFGQQREWKIEGPPHIIARFVKEFCRD